jgi:hypothetical protein
MTGNKFLGIGLSYELFGPVLLRATLLFCYSDRSATVLSLAPRLLGRNIGIVLTNPSSSRCHTKVGRPKSDISRCLFLQSSHITHIPSNCNEMSSLRKLQICVVCIRYYAFFTQNSGGELIRRIFSVRPSVRLSVSVSSLTYSSNFGEISY